MKRARDDNAYFTCCPRSSAIVSGWHDFADHRIRKMIDEGLNVTLNTDDPTMMNTDIGTEYAEGCVGMGLDVEQVKRIVLAGVDATWLDDTDKKALRREFEHEIARLESELTPT